MSNMGRRRIAWVWVGAFVAALAVVRSGAELCGAELARLTAATWNEFVPAGKERDCILGDLVLRNDRITAVIAQPVAGRNANMTVRNVGWCVIDLTQRLPANDQLSAFYPGSLRYSFTRPEAIRWEDEQGAYPLEAGDFVLRRPRITVSCPADPVQGLEVTVRYTLADGDAALLVETLFRNTTDQPVEVELSDTVRADRTFQFSTALDENLFLADDEFFRQTYGIFSAEHKVKHSGGRGVVVQYLSGAEAKIQLAPGEKRVLARQLYPAANKLQALAIGRLLRGESVHRVEVVITDPRGAVAAPRVELYQGDALLGAARGDAEGRVVFGLPSGEYRMVVSGLGRPASSQSLAVSGDTSVRVGLEPAALLIGRVTDTQGNFIPCKVQFQGLEGTPTPDFGPDTAVTVRNLKYSATGRFRQELLPGKYRVLVSYGPEYHAHVQTVELQAGQPARLEVQLERCVDTRGWISADFHSHSSPSGDNTCSQRARVLNLLCEHIEFAPCTEHNRIDTYVPHLRALGVEHLMGTCSGIELTGALGSVNHQNAFPLRMRPRIQDNGAPLTDANPVAQIARLAMWDGQSEKLVQCNHPDLVQILADRDKDGKGDGGFFDMVQYMDVIEVHPLQPILLVPGTEAFQAAQRNTIFHWLQMLNLGFRIPGVVNTDAHYSFHGSGGLRNFVRSTTDDPSRIDPLEVVRAAAGGHLVMSNGPFLEVTARSGDQAAGPGDDLAAPDGQLELHIRVQCPNWLDINRVQILANGRQMAEGNFTRRQHPERFGDGVVKFEQSIPLQLSHDTHLVVVAAGEGLTVGEVMGPQWGSQMPIAVANPIFVDVDGNGFRANGDLLDVPLPLDQTPGIPVRQP
ncbi:MAG: hypothetical protein KatS3mg110_0209 [Pirellulaceae bacterium]|nr:MAG: hypothetical protein KatS3mg110_0209 [Pirellulaceae bacterium]